MSATLLLGRMSKMEVETEMYVVGKEFFIRVSFKTKIFYL